jgi:hypothetical protein
MYVFNITNAIDYFGPFGHLLGVDAFANSTCSSYATPVTVANALASYQQQGGNLNTYSPSNPRSCYAFLGKNQPGVNEADPTFNSKDATPANPSACVPDPGAAPLEPPQYGIKYTGPTTSACKLVPSSTPAADKGNAKGAGSGAAAAGQTTSGAPPGSSSSSGPVNVGQTLSGVLSTLGLGSAAGTVNGAVGKATGAATGAASQGTAGSAGPVSGSQTQQLLQYLLAP